MSVFLGAVKTESTITLNDLIGKKMVNEQLLLPQNVYNCTLKVKIVYITCISFV
jgi:hypothetical protein